MDKPRPAHSAAFANNQWKFDAERESTISLDKTSFSRAMALSLGTVSVIDKDGIYFSRIWVNARVRQKSNLVRKGCT